MSANSPSNYQLRPVAEWDEEYLNQLPSEEFDWLDFKSSAWLQIKGGTCLEELSKYVSAYANFDGGYLIIGVNDPRKKGAIVIDGGVRADLVPGGIDSWLEDKIPNLADGRLNRLEVRALHPKESSSAIAPGCCIIIIHVPASESAPHQARDHKYYTRLSSKLSGLGHRAVMDILSRRKHPKIEIHYVGVTQLHGSDFVVSALVENTSTVLARFFSLVVDIPTVIGNAALSYKGQRFTTDDGFDVVRVNLRTNNLPLFPLRKTPLRAQLEVGLASPGEFANTISEIRYKAFADEMPFIEGSVSLEKGFNKL